MKTVTRDSNQKNFHQKLRSQNVREIILHLISWKLLNWISCEQHKVSEMSCKILLYLVVDAKCILPCNCALDNTLNSLVCLPHCLSQVRYYNLSADMHSGSIIVFILFRSLSPLYGLWGGPHKPTLMLYLKQDTYCFPVVFHCDFIEFFIFLVACHSYFMLCLQPFALI